MIKNIPTVSLDRAIELMKIERECVSRDWCNRKCEICDLVQKEEDLIAAYDMVIKTLEGGLHIEK